MRICSRCGEQRVLTDFPERKLGTGRRHGHCRACKASYQKAWYEKNKDRHKRNVAAANERQRARNRKIADAAKDRPCADCGRRYPPYVMDLDHVRGTKSRNVALLVGMAVSERVLRAEIAKCEVVCANCHRERTFSLRASDDGSDA